MNRLAIFPLIKKTSWVFRTSVADNTQIMIMAFGPNSQFLLRVYTDEDDAKAFIDEAAAGKHVE